MPEARRLSVRVDDRLLRRIDAARGEASVSTWFRETCARRLEAECGLGPEFRDDLAAHPCKAPARRRAVSQRKSNCYALTVVFCSVAPETPDRCATSHHRLPDGGTMRVDNSPCADRPKHPLTSFLNFAAVPVRMSDALRFLSVNSLLSAKDLLR